MSKPVKYEESIEFQHDGTYAIQKGRCVHLDRFHLPPPPHWPDRMIGNSPGSSPLPRTQAPLYTTVWEYHFQTAGTDLRRLLDD